MNAATEQNNPFQGLLSDQTLAGSANPQLGTENRDPLPNPWRPAERSNVPRPPNVAAAQPPTDRSQQSWINQMAQQVRFISLYQKHNRTFSFKIDI